MAQPPGVERDMVDDPGGPLVDTEGPQNGAPSRDPRSMQAGTPWEMGKQEGELADLEGQAGGGAQVDMEDQLAGVLMDLKGQQAGVPVNQENQQELVVQVILERQ